MKVGFVVNPIAGMGGPVGLKGTDGEDSLKEAVSRGAHKGSPERAAAALVSIRSVRGIEFLTAGGEMGEDELRSAGIDPDVVHRPPRKSTRKDTLTAVSQFLKSSAEIIVFAGGDGTARDVLEAADMKVPILGIPTGVKMESAVFANSPEDVVHLLEAFSATRETREAEVMDVDEEGVRQGVLNAKIYGYALTPDDPAHLQSSKEAYHTDGAASEAAEIGQYVADTMEDGVVYVLGPGTTTARIAEHLSEPKTLLGVDVFLDKKLVLRDAAEKDLISFLKTRQRAKILVSPIGAQGFFFGRGNQQISAAVISIVGVQNVIVIATPTKLTGTPVLRVDTGDPTLDKHFRGRMRVVTGYRRRRLATVM